MSNSRLMGQGSGVWRDLYDLVYRSLRMRGVSHFDAEDIAQDVLETAYRHLDTVDPNRRRAWLLAVARNKLADRARRTNQMQTVAEVPEAADPALGPDEMALQSLDRGVLLEAIAALPSRDRLLVEARYFEEATIAEIAGRLEMSAGAAKVALHRARTRLRGTLEAATRRGEAMSEIGERAINALSPYVGPAVADLCVRGVAITLDKTFDQLTIEDSPALEKRARNVLSSLLPQDAIERVVARIRGGAA